MGKDVTGFAPGNEVYGICDGSFAAYARVRTDKLARKPANLSFDQAAAVPISGLTALQGVRDHGRVQAGQRVLIVGASGGVGSFAVQIAKAYGAEVTGVCSTAKVDLVRAIGADHVVDYTRDDFADGKHRYDVILALEATLGCPICGVPSPRREGSSLSEARPMVGGWAASTVSSGRTCCPYSSARSSEPSSRRRTPRI